MSKRGDYALGMAPFQMLSIEEAATALSVHPQTVRKLIKRGELAAIKVARHWRVSENVLTEFATATRPKTPIAKTNGAAPDALDTDDAAQVEAMRAQLQRPLDASEVEVRRRAASELDALFARLNAEVEEETGQPLPHYGAPDFADLVADGYDERESEQL